MQLSTNEAIFQIQKVYRAQYNPESCFDACDQLLACEAIAEATPVKEEHYQENERTNENVSVNGVINDSCKHKVNLELTQSKLRLVEELKTFNYKTPPNKIAPVLEEFFKEWPSYDGHWRYIAQHYPPRIINRVINYIIKNHSSGRRIILNPAAYFTDLIKYRKERKEFRTINGSRRQRI